MNKWLKLLVVTGTIGVVTGVTRSPGEGWLVFVIFTIGFGFFVLIATEHVPSYTERDDPMARLRQQEHMRRRGGKS